jgi:tRNA nucleotidyltransferase (CCA-adding enzyme)
MKAYLVGGAVRDRLLNRPITEKDWVIVGGSTHYLISKGYQQVGKDFPVFLHPVTKEEYALARIEKKVGKGYKGFEFETDVDVSLEQDLKRRDLTINAIAEDEDGSLIDPFGGLNDLKARLLKHVSYAFNEDPVRILRVARFKARFAPLGFKIAVTTKKLMRDMVRMGEMENLVAERVWKEWQKSLTEPNPECFIQVLRDCGGLKIILPELDILFGIPNPPKHHPEIDSGVHSLMVLKVATKLSKDPKVRFAALMHDLGKGVTPVGLWPSHPGHDDYGVDVILKLAKRLKIPKSYYELAQLASKYHITIHRLHELRASTIVTVLEKLDAFRKLERFKGLLLVCKADVLGRLNHSEKSYLQYEQWLDIVAQLNKLNVKEIISQGYEGDKIKQQLHRQRIERVKIILNGWN